jgi:hypothetical protein
MASTPDQAAFARLRADDGTSALSGPWLFACYAVALALLIWPIVQVTNPMLADYPNHLARLYVASALDTSETLSRFYVRHDGLYPYLPFDLLVTLLGRTLGLEAAGRVFIALTLTMPCLGTLALAKALHGRVGLWPIVSALFAYNMMLSWGLITFLFSLGLALLVFAGWIATQRWAWPQRLAVFTPLATLIFCGHPFAFAALGLLVAAWEASSVRRFDRAELKAVLPRLLLAGLQFLPALLLATQMPHADFGSDITGFGTGAERISAFLSPFLFFGDGGEALVACVWPLALTIALRRGDLVLDRRMLLPIAALGLVALAMPAYLSGIYLVHIRLPLLVVLLIVASCRPRAVPTRTVVLALVVGASVLALRTAEISARMREADDQVAELRVAASAIEEGARVMPAIASNHGDGLPRKNYWHANAYLTIDRSAFYPLLFSFYNIGVTDAYAGIATPATSPVELEELDAPPEKARPTAGLRNIYWRNWRENFDYVVLFDFGDGSLPLPDGLLLVRRGAAFAIYKVVREAPPYDPAHAMSGWR